MKRKLLVLLMAILVVMAMMPTTAFAAGGTIDVRGNVTVTEIDYVPTCYDNLYLGHFNVNGKATESKTRLTHTVLPLVQWSVGYNIYQVIPSAYRYYVSNIKDPNHILEKIEGGVGLDKLQGWPGQYECYQTTVITDGKTNGTATFDIDLVYDFTRLDNTIGWPYRGNTGGRTLHFTIRQTVAETTKCTVTYTDGVDDEEIFPDQKYTDLASGSDTPAFQGETPTRKGYVFGGWNPTVAAKVTENATYEATWKVDSNNNGIADDEETKYTVTYTDGVEDEEVFADDVHAGLLSGTATPAFTGGTPTRNGYNFMGWNPTVSNTVTGDITYKATWEEDKGQETTYTVTYTDGVAD